MNDKSRTITVRGAREHNLKGVDLTIPRDSLVVFTGLSGSGKSSLAFDTIYAEGQRRYVESLSAYARQFLQMMQKPEVDSIDGLSPAISIEQKTTSKNPRSTVATVTEIHDYMRLLWARIGIPYSPATGLPIESQTVSQMVDRIMAEPEGTRLLLLAPVVRDRKGEFKSEIAEWQAKGFQRLKVDGTVYAIDEVPDLDKKFKHDIQIVVDRIVVREEDRSRIAESFEQAVEAADGLAIAEFVDDAAVPAEEGAPSGPRGSKVRRGERAAVGAVAKMVAAGDSGPRTITFSTRFACPVSGFTLPELEPRLFSFNSPEGTCRDCGGLGVQPRVDGDKLVPNPDLSLDDGAVAPWDFDQHPEYRRSLADLCRHFGVSMKTPWKDLPDAMHLAVISGSPEEIAFSRTLRGEGGVRSGRFEGVYFELSRRYACADNGFAGKATKASIERFRTDFPCAGCHGMRLAKPVLCVKVGVEGVGPDAVTPISIGDVARLSVSGALDWFTRLDGRLAGNAAEIGGRILKEIRDRLRFLLDVGLDYLTLDRSSGTLSGGESQRIRLASQIGSGLTGVLYVLDEPSIGLHQRDNARLLETLVRLRDLGNTVIVVEHDEDAVMAADHVVDVGPGAGVEGGRIVAQGTPAQILADQASLTGRYLSGELQVVDRLRRRRPDPRKVLSVRGARGNNLKGVDADVPLGTFTVVTGASGSGKSTLILDTLYRAVARKVGNGVDAPEAHDSITGIEHLDKVIEMDQSPIGRTPRSNPLTYVGGFGPIREWFAGLPEAKARGFKPGRFSFNVKGGRCEKCQGGGVLTIEMHFLPDVEVSCPVCEGRRFDRETLEVRFKGHSISDVLAMPIAQAHELFKSVPAIRDKLATLVRVGLGYVKVGQPATTLSGGEAQRVKLAKELSRRSTGRTLYVLDEPTTGLHFHDIRKLLELLHELVDGGNTVLVIEHNLEVVKTADWVIDLGPEGGHRGGELLCAGTPEAIAAHPTSWTGRYLKEVLERRRMPSLQAAE